MLRIFPVERTGADGTTVLRLAGRVVGPWVDELRVVVSREMVGSNGNGHRHVVLDLAEVSFVAADALPLFRELLTRRVRLTNCSRFVQEQLRPVTDGAY
jgi:hypothetical protein